MEDHPINLVTSPSFLPISISGENSGSAVLVDEPNPSRRNLPDNENRDSSESAVINNESLPCPKFYCVRTVEQQTEVYNDNILDCTLTFIANKNICIFGLQVPSQILNMVNNHF